MHARRCDDKVELQRRISRKRGGIDGFSGEPVSGRMHKPLAVDLVDALLHLKQPCAARDLMRLQRRRHGKTDRLVRAALVRNDKVCVEWVKPALRAFDGGIE